MADAAATAGNGDFSLSETFDKFNHWRHIVMDLSMIGMAMGAVVAAGASGGLLNPIWSWAQMHFAGIPALFTAGPEFLSGAFENASNGVFFTDTGVDPHAMHGSDALETPTQPELTDGARDILGIQPQ